MLSLQKMTIPQLLGIYNQQHPTQPIKSWKRSKIVLLERIKSVQTIKSAVLELLYYLNGNNEGLRYDEILNSLREEFPDCKTTLKGLRWYATTFQRKFPDRRMPIRPRRSKKYREGYNPKTA